MKLAFVSERDAKELSDYVEGAYAAGHFVSVISAHVPGWLDEYLSSGILAISEERELGALSNVRQRNVQITEANFREFLEVGYQEQQHKDYVQFRPWIVTNLTKAEYAAHKDDPQLKAEANRLQKFRMDDHAINNFVENPHLKDDVSLNEHAENLEPFRPIPGIMIYQTSNPKSIVQKLYESDKNTLFLQEYNIVPAFSKKRKVLLNTDVVTVPGYDMVVADPDTFTDSMRDYQRLVLNQ